MSENKHDIFVVGTGQMRTGTKSLKVALEILYKKGCFHMDEIIFKHPDQIDLWIETLDKGYLDKDLAKKLLDGYCCTADNPAGLFYEDLMKFYPNCKIILTKRDPDEWLKSVRKTKLKKSTLFQRFCKSINYESILPRFQELQNKTNFYGLFEISELLEGNDKALKVCYEDYNERIRLNVPKERLLEFDVKEGWEPLCSFLGLPIPNEPFPYVNKASEYKSKFKMLFLKSWLKCSIYILLFAIYFGVILKISTMMLR